MNKKFIKIFIIILIVCLAIFVFINRTRIKQWVVDFNKTELPMAVDFKNQDRSPRFTGEAGESGIGNRESNDLPVNQNINTYLNTNSKIPDVQLPTSYNLNVPFTSQAPKADWSEPFKEACEEASLLMVHEFFTKGALEPETATQKIIDLVNWQNQNWNGDQDITIEQVSQLAEEYYGYKKFEIINNPTVTEIKQYLSDNLPVIVPAAGRELGNPNFQTPGPLYHMLVLKGYTETQFITNDPGTRNGHNFLYDYDVLMNAIHDWNYDNDILEGDKQILVIYPNT